MSARHATEDVHEPERTLCGRKVASVEISNHDPSCRVCLRVIRSRCDQHNVSRCEVCP